jgi:hypothetical protein
MRCKTDGCDKLAKRKDGRCDYHYRKNLPKKCIIEGCNESARGRGLCGKHWQRWKKNGDPMVVQKVRNREYGHTRINNNGYVVEFVPGHIQSDADGKAMQHRRIMADSIGRKLYDFENVHHKNGIRSDNRLENLELWITRQPYGQRVSDQIEWAKWILEQNGEQRP